MPQTAEAAPPAAALVIPPALIYLARNPQMLNRIMNTVKSLPRLWVEIRELKKNLEIRAQNIEDLFVHEKNDSKVESFDEYDGVFAGIFERSSKKPSTSASSRSNINSGGGSAMPPDPEKEPRKDKGQSEKIRIERAYGKGKYWSGLSRNANLSKKSKGQTKVDAEGDAYKFDPKHKTTKVHLHRYRHKGGNKEQFIHAGFTQPVNTVLYEYGVGKNSSMATTDNYVNPGSDFNRTVLKQLTTDACTKLKNAGARVYVVKYRHQTNWGAITRSSATTYNTTSTAHSYTEIDNCATSSGGATYDVSTESDLKNKLDEIATNIKSWAGYEAAKQE